MRERAAAHRDSERETPGDSLLLRAALPPGWEVFSIERTRSGRHSGLVANPLFSL